MKYTKDGCEYLAAKYTVTLAEVLEVFGRSQLLSWLVAGKPGLTINGASPQYGDYITMNRETGMYDIYSAARFQKLFEPVMSEIESRLALVEYKIDKMLDIMEDIVLMNADIDERGKQHETDIEVICDEMVKKEQAINDLFDAVNKAGKYYTGVNLRGSQES
jgi:hypothetical protein